MKSALIVIDVQNLLVDAKPYRIEECLENIQELLSVARRSDMEIIFVRHSDQEFIYGSPEWELSDILAVRNNEKIVDKHFNSIFKDTDLNEYLKQSEINHLILCGMVTNYCVDTSCRVAFELGYQVTIAEGSTTLFATEDFAADLLQDYYEDLWHERFAQVLPMEDVLKIMR